MTGLQSVLPKNCVFIYFKLFFSLPNLLFSHSKSAPFISAVQWKTTTNCTESVHESISSELSTQSQSNSQDSERECNDRDCRGVDSDEDIDISSIDDEHPKSEVPSSLLSDIPSIPSTSRQTCFRLVTLTSSL